MRNYKNFGPQFDRGEWNGPRFFREHGFEGRETREGHEGHEGHEGREGHGHHGHHEHGGRRHFGEFMRPTPEMLVLRSTAMEVARLFAIAARTSIGNTEKQSQLREFLERSRKELLDLIGTSAQNEQAAPTENTSPDVTEA